MRRPLNPSVPDEAPAHYGNLNTLSVSGDTAGLLVTVIVLVLALIGLPVTRWFLSASIGVGVVVSLIFRWTARKRS